VLCGPTVQNTNQVRRELGSRLSLMTNFHVDLKCSYSGVDEYLGVLGYDTMQI
jgi:hypothetical protein